MNYLDKQNPESIEKYLTNYMDENPYLKELVSDLVNLPKIEYTDIITPTPYRISTMTCIFNLNELIDDSDTYSNASNTKNQISIDDIIKTYIGNNIYDDYFFKDEKKSINEKIHPKPIKLYTSQSG